MIGEVDRGDNGASLIVVEQRATTYSMPRHLRHRR